jgi:hypothetical protein
MGDYQHHTKTGSEVVGIARRALMEMIDAV